MSRLRRQDPDLDELIAEITVDCYDEDEQLRGFENGFDEHAPLPCPGTAVGERVDVLHIGQADNRRELVATCRRHVRTYQVAMLDIDLSADPTTARLLAVPGQRLRLDLLESKALAACDRHAVPCGGAVAGPAADRTLRCPACRRRSLARRRPWRRTHWARSQPRQP